jgi:hypothetical protein
VSRYTFLSFLLDISDQSGGGTVMDVDRARSGQENEDQASATPVTRTGSMP